MPLACDLDCTSGRPSYSLTATRGERKGKIMQIFGMLGFHPLSVNCAHNLRVTRMESLHVAFFGLIAKYPNYPATQTTAFVADGSTTCMTKVGST